MKDDTIKSAPRSAFAHLRDKEQAQDTPKSLPPKQKNTKKVSAPAAATFPELTLPGIKPVLELLQQEPEKIDAVFIQKGRRQADLDQILDACRTAAVRFSLVDAAALKRFYDGNHQGVIARLSTASLCPLEELLQKAATAPLPLLIALDQVQDTGNVGALARTLYAFGGAGLIIPRHNGVYLGAAAAKASAGALTRLPVAKVSNLAHALDTAEEMGFAIYGAAMTATTGQENRSVFDFTPDFPAILVLGSEESGLRPVTTKRCQAFIHIPMLRHFDSLNVAQAGAILLGRFLQSFSQ